MGAPLWFVNGTQVGGGGGGGSDDQTAAEVPFTPAGGIAATDVQAAIEELDSEKVPISRTVTAGAGLTGGGDLSANRTFDVGAGTGITVNANDVAVDPAVVATLTGSQTLTNKTLTTPTINGAALSGTLSGDHTVSGVATFTAAPVVAIDDATTNAITDVATMRHTTSGTAAANIGTGLLFSAENAGGSNVDVARVAAVLTTATASSEVGALVVHTRTGGSVTEVARFHGSGTVSFGNTVDPGGVKGTILYGDGTGSTQNLICYASSSQIKVIQLFSAGSCIVGPATGGYNVTLFSAGTKVHFQTTANDFLDLSNGNAVWGNDTFATAGGTWTHRGPDTSSSADQAGHNVECYAGRGRGNGAASYTGIGGSIAAASGTTQHTRAISFKAYGQYAATTAGIARKKRNSADADITVAADDHILAFTSLTAARAVTLLAPGAGGASATSPRMYVVKDESGSCDGTNTITLSVSGGANIDGAATLVINTAYGKATVYDNGTKYFTV